MQCDRQHGTVRDQLPDFILSHFNNRKSTEVERKIHLFRTEQGENLLTSDPKNIFNVITETRYAGGLLNNGTAIRECSNVVSKVLLSRVYLYWVFKF